MGWREREKQGGVSRSTYTTRVWAGLRRMEPSSQAWTGQEQGGEGGNRKRGRNKAEYQFLESAPVVASQLRRPVSTKRRGRVCVVV